MATNTVVGVFDSYAQAEQALNQLVTAGIARNRIEIASNEAATATAGATTTHDESLGDRISHFFSRLFGGEHAHHDVEHYSEAVRRGSAVVTIDAANESEAERAADILDD